MNTSELKKFVNDNPRLVRMKSYFGLFVLKYNRVVFRDSLWNEYLEECRGLVVDNDFNIVAYPFTKIYNFGIEKLAPDWDDDKRVSYVRKVNGFMIACTWYEGDLLWSTTGSLSSDFIAYAKAIFERQSDDQQRAFRAILESNSNDTFIFECVHEADPHIVPEENGLYLLGYREKKLGSKIHYRHDSLLWNSTGVFLLKVYTGTVRDVKNYTRECRHEGFVLYSDGISTKIKSPYYLVNKLFARGSINRLLNGKAREIMDEEYYPLIEYVSANRNEFELMTEQQRLTFTRDYLENMF